jgi:hypothetical protein
MVQTRDNPAEPERIDRGRRELYGERYPAAACISSAPLC